MTAHNSLAALLRFLPSPSAGVLGTVWGDDAFGVRYRFDIHNIWDAPFGFRVVYMFTTLAGPTYVPLYIGRAELLEQRLPRHERRLEAVRGGATHLLVHTPTVWDRVDFEEAERRLIQHYAPPLNEHHNPLAAIFQ